MTLTSKTTSLDPDRPKHLRKRMVDIYTGDSRYTQGVDPATETMSNSQQSEGLKVKQITI